MAIATDWADLEAVVQQFADGFLDGLEQKQDILSPFVTLDMVEGDKKFYDRMGPLAIREKAGRRQKVEFSEPQTERRVVSWRSFYVAVAIEEDDILRTLKDPQGKLLERALDAFSRKRMQVIVDALVGNAFTGETGGTSVPFTAGNKLVSGGAGMGIDFIKDMSERFFNLKAGPQFGNGPLNWLISTKQAKDFLSISEFVQREFGPANRFEAVSNYQPFSWNGWNFIPLPDGQSGDDANMDWTGLPKDSNNDRSTLAFTKDSINLVVKKEVSAKLQSRNDFVGLKQVVIEGKFAASRMRELSVYDQLCRE